MVGSVKTWSMNRSHLEAGAIAVLRSPDYLEVCTIECLDPNGSWVVQGETFSGPMLPDMTLCKLIVIDNDRQYYLKFNQWKKSIKAGEVDSDKEVTFEVVPAKFVDGHYMNTCSLCYSSFMGHKRQPVCKTCCDANVHAKITIGKKEIKPATKPKRPRMFKPEIVKQLLIKAYHMGIEGKTAKQFYTWLNNIF